MSDSKNPWQQKPEPKRTQPRVRFWIWLALLLAAAAGVWKLAELFPGQVSSDWDRANLMQLVVVLGIVSASVLFGSRLSLRTALRNFVLWAALVAVLVLGFTFQTELQNVAQRVRSELIPDEPVSITGNELALSESADGHFYVMGEANGTRIRFLVDTGASDIVLSPQDAERLGVDVKTLDFARTYQTANGLGQGAAYRLDNLTIGPIALMDVPISINRAEMRSSLLGMSFLKQLGSFEIKDRHLYLRAR